MTCFWCEEEWQAGEEIYNLPEGTRLCRTCLREWAEQFKDIYEGEEKDEGF